MVKVVCVHLSCLPFLQALAEYEKVQQVLGADLDEKVHQDAKNLIDELFGFMKNGCILHAIETETKKDKLRELIRGEIKDVRNRFGGKEADQRVLPPPSFEEGQ